MLNFFHFVGMLGEESWPPAVEFYDFLKIIDTQEPNSAHQRTPEEKEEEEAVDEEDVNVEDETVVEEATDSSSSSLPDTNRNTHSEL